MPLADELGISYAGLRAKQDLLERPLHTMHTILLRFLLTVVYLQPRALHDVQHAFNRLLQYDSFMTTKMSKFQLRQEFDKKIEYGLSRGWIVYR